MNIFGITIIKSSEYERLVNSEYELAETKTKLNKQVAIFQTLNKKYKESEAKISNLEETIERKDKEIISSGETLSEAQETLQKTSNNLKRVMSSLKEKSKEISELNIKLNKLSALNDKISQANVSLMAEVEALTKENSFVRGKLSLYEKQESEKENDSDEVQVNTEYDAEQEAPENESGYELAEVPEEVEQPQDEGEVVDDEQTDGNSAAEADNIEHEVIEPNTDGLDPSMNLGQFYNKSNVPGSVQEEAVGDVPEIPEQPAVEQEQAVEQPAAPVSSGYKKKKKNKHNKR